MNDKSYNSPHLIGGTLFPPIKKGTINDMISNPDEVFTYRECSLTMNKRIK